MADTDDTTIEDERTSSGEEEVLPFQYSITAYGADYPVDGLVKRLKAGTIYVPPFQRNYVWNLKQASRFVESLLLGLPVPGVFLSREEESSRLLVIDGQQRLKSLQFFYDGVFAATSREFALSGVQSAYSGATYSSLDEDTRVRLDDAVIHATIIRQDVPTDDSSSIYHVFERLNTGGTQLSPQEIRACIFHGPFNELLSDLNDDASWRAIFGRVNRRIRDQELILRFLAFRFFVDRYEEPMKGFLNAYMGRNRNLKLHSASRLTKDFTSTISLVHEAIGTDAFRPVRALNAAVFDAVMVGLSRRLEAGPVKQPSEVGDRYAKLLASKDFLAAIERTTASRESVTRRLAIATSAFESVR